jgi:phage-related tail fiber protein
MLWFRTQLPHSLINPNQLRAYGIDVNDDPFDSTRDFGIDSKQAFIPFDTMGTIVHFESRTPATEWEKTHLPIILITSDVWNPTEEVLCPEKQSHESIKMRMIRSLHLGS